MNLHIETRGDAKNPAVLCLHGLLGAARNLWRITDGLAAAGFYVISYDQRGHGRSAWSQDYSLQALAQDALDALTMKSVSSAHFLGHSLGGRVSLAASQIAPQRVKSLTLLDVGPRISAAAVYALSAIIDPLPLEGFKDRASAEAVLSQQSDAMAQFLYSNLKKAGPTTQGDVPLQWIFDLKGLREFLASGIRVDQSEAFKNSKCPILMLRGAESKHFSADEVSYALSLKLGLRTGVVPGAGHWLHVDNLESTMQQVLVFLKGLP